MPRPRTKSTYRQFTEAARNLRHKPTKAEEILWEFLRNRKLGNFKFRRQYPLEPHIVDFYCPERKLQIELDRSVHMDPNRARLDIERTRRLEEKGIKVLRFQNEDVEQSLEDVAKGYWRR